MKNYLGKNIRYLRKQYRFSQEQLGDLLGFSHSAISCWERGAREPNHKEIVAICEKFNLTPDILCYTDIEIKAANMKDYTRYQQMLDLWDNLSADQQTAIITTMKAMVG